MSLAEDLLDVTTLAILSDHIISVVQVCIDFFLPSLHLLLCLTLHRLDQVSSSQIGVSSLVLVSGLTRSWNVKLTAASNVHIELLLWHILFLDGVGVEKHIDTGVAWLCVFGGAHGAPGE